MRSGIEVQALYRAAAAKLHAVEVSAARAKEQNHNPTIWKNQPL
jgi:hypothetical protein